MSPRVVYTGPGFRSDHTGVEDAVGGVGPHGLIDRCAGGSLRSVDSQVLVRVTVEAIRVASSHR